jgi:hypothetical protein
LRPDGGLATHGETPSRMNGIADAPYSRGSE